MAARAGLPALSPEDVHDEWAVACPTGVERADAIKNIRIPIVGLGQRGGLASAPELLFEGLTGYGDGPAPAAASTGMNVADWPVRAR
jgi:hypothetical protein